MPCDYSLYDGCCWTDICWLKMKKVLILLILGLILVSGCGKLLKENTTINQKSINNFCTQDTECEALFSSCSCNYIGCVKKTDEPRTDCAWECPSPRTELAPVCVCVHGDCKELIEYKCPTADHLDCMPAFLPENANYCQPKYSDWIEKNCNVSISD